MIVLAQLWRSLIFPCFVSLTLVTVVFAEDPGAVRMDSNTEPENIRRQGRGLERQVAFLDFYNESSNEEYSQLQTAIGEGVYEATRRRYNYSRIEKSIWQRNTAASHFKSEDFINRQKIQTLGEAIPADGIVYGKFKVSGDKIQISAWVLSILSHEIIAEASTSISRSKDLNQEIQIFSEQLSKRVVELFIPADRGAIWRSALLPGWGQVYKGRKTAGYIYGGAVGTGFAFSLFSLVMWQTSYSRYRNYDPDHVITPQGGTELIDPAESQAQFDRYASQVQTWQKITLISVGVTLVIYLWQIMDAWLFDSRYAELAKRTPTARSNGPSLILGGLVHDADQTNQVQNRMHGQLDFGLKISF